MIALDPALAFWVLLALALGFNFMNGFLDASSIVATVISSRALAPRAALAWTALFEFLGPYALGVAVAQTIGADIVRAEHISILVLYAGLAAAILWNWVTWYFGIPSSSSHALVGGLVGAVAMASGPQVIRPAGLTKVLIALFTSPLLGFVVGYILLKVLLALLWWATPRVNQWFRRAQIFTLAALALSHGANDGQKAMGIITLGLMTLGYLSSFVVPFWVIVICSITMALGAYTGAWRLIHTLGAKFYRIRPIHGFCIQSTAASVVFGAALLGGPVSTTQVLSAAVVGVGAAERASKVRWKVAQDIATAWVLTIPITALLAAGIYTLLVHYVTVVL